MYAIQLDFFEDESETLVKEIFETRKMADKIRKAMFARHGELSREITDLKERLAILERNVCKNK